MFAQIAHAYDQLQVLDMLGNVASTTQGTLVDTITRFLPIAIPVVIAMALLWWVLRRFGVRR